MELPKDARWVSLRGSPKLHTRLMYFHLALYCDSPILEALYFTGDLKLVFTGIDTEKAYEYFYLWFRWHWACMTGHSADWRHERRHDAEEAVWSHMDVISRTTPFSRDSVTFKLDNDHVMVVALSLRSGDFSRRTSCMMELTESHVIEGLLLADGLPIDIDETRLLQMLPIGITEPRRWQFFHGRVDETMKQLVKQFLTDANSFVFTRPFPMAPNPC